MVGLAAYVGSTITKLPAPYEHLARPRRRRRRWGSHEDAIFPKFKLWVDLHLMLSQLAVTRVRPVGALIHSRRSMYGNIRSVEHGLELLVVQT